MNNMQNSRTITKLLIFAIAILLTNFTNLSAQEAKSVSRYNSELYKFSFQIPNDSVKRADSTEQRITFIGDQTKFGAGSSLVFSVMPSDTTDGFTKLLSSDEGMEAIATLLFNQLKQKNTKIEFLLLEKKRVQIAGKNAFKIVTSANFPNGKIRSAMFVIPVSEHKRMYSFIVTSTDDTYDKWYSNVEVSINSFEYSKAVVK